MRRAVVLAAGVGARLRPWTHDRPKVLVEVDGVPILVRLARQLAARGVTEVIVATGWCEDAVIRASERVRGVRWVIRRNAEYDRTQNVASLHACGAALLEGGPRETIKLDGDLYVDEAVLDRLLGASMPTGGLLAAVDRSAPLGDEEMKVRTTGDRIEAFGKGLDPAHAHGESIGLERIAADAVSSIVDAVGRAVTEGETHLYYEDVYDRLLAARGGPIDARAIDVSGLAWTEIDTPDDLARAERLARAAGSRSAR